MDKNALFVENLTVFFEKNPALWEVSFTIPQGKMVGIIGPNGAGKSTLLKALLGLVKPSSGNVRFFGLPYKKLRRRIAYVPQRGSIDWDFPIRVIDVALMGCLGKRRFLGPSQKDKQKAREMLDLLGILSLEKRQISELSGGQQQRLFLARALLQEADLLFLDEPFSGVDMTTENVLVAVLKKLKDEGKTIFIVHHDLNSVESYFDFLLMLNQRLVAYGETKDIFHAENLIKIYGNQGALLEEMTRRRYQKVFTR